MLSRDFQGLTPGQVETQIRYGIGETPHVRRQLRQWREALRALEHTELEQEKKVGGFWLRSALLLAALGVIFASEFLLAAGLSVLAFVVFCWLWDRFSLTGLRYQRSFSEFRVFMGETIEMTLEVRNQKPLPLPTLEITDGFPATLPIEGVRVELYQVTKRGDFRSFWMIGAFQRLTRRFTIHCTRRGYHNFGPVLVTTGDGAGLFSRRAVMPYLSSIIVYPRLYSAEALRLPAKNPFGERASKERLFEDPLRTAGIREWQPADNLRRVHWKATARHQRMLSRLYEPSEEPQVMIFLNTATLPRYWEGIVPELMERTISVAGSLAALCVEARLPVGLVANAYWPGSDQTLRLLPGRSPNQLTHILEMLAAINIANRPIEELLLREAPGLPWGATLLVVTAVAHEELLDALGQLVQAGRKVVLFTLAEAPPQQALFNITVYHLSHLVDDLICPTLLAEGGLSVMRPR